jgi:hypothetical protein
MPGASDRTQPIKNLNANWTPGEDGDDGRFEIQMITDDGQRHVVTPSPAAAAALVAMATADTVLLWDPEGPSVIVANIVGRMPWTDPSGVAAAVPAER